MANRKKVPRIQEPINDNSQVFKWAIDGSCANFTSEYFGLTCCFQDGTFVNCILPQLNQYSQKTWAEIQQNKHNHSFDITEITNNELQNIYIKLEIETAYQLCVPLDKSKHRIWGKREGPVFYLIANDPEHIGYPTSKKHT